MVCHFPSTFSLVRTLPSTSCITYYLSLLCEAKQPAEVRLWDGSETCLENTLLRQSDLQIQVSTGKQGIWTQLLSSLFDVLTTKEHPYWYGLVHIQSHKSCCKTRQPSACPEACRHVWLYSLKPVICKDCTQKFDHIQDFSCYCPVILTMWCQKLE